MSRLSKLFGSPKEFIIGGEPFLLHPLGVEVTQRLSFA